MAILSHEYWKKFIEKDKNGKEKGNGREFEKLVRYLLYLMYGKKWRETGGSHDHNRDFWLHLSDQNLWAECKNYSNTIAMNILAPTLVMAQIYEVNEILFFSRSNINRFAKDKILAYGEKTHKTVRFFDGENIDELICSYASKLPARYSPIKYMSNRKSVIDQNSFINIYFFQNRISRIYDDSEVFVNYESIDKIYYNETFSLTFCLNNAFYEDQVDVYIEFADEDPDRFYFEYFFQTIRSDKKRWYHTCLKKGEGCSVSLNMRQIVYKPIIKLPSFHILFVCARNGKSFEWESKKISVKCKWVGQTRLIGNYYLNLLDDVQEILINNPYISGLVISGSSGTGKTRVITECQNIFLGKGYEIINLSAQENYSSHYYIKELIAFLYEMPSDEILDLLEEKIFISSREKTLSESNIIEKATSLFRVIMNSTTEEDLQEVLNKYEDILFEKLSKGKNTIIIDNFQFSGKAFQNFIERYIKYSVNQQSINQSIIVCVFNTDYLTAKTSELLYSIVNLNIRHCISVSLNGFKDREQGILFLQELTRTNSDENLEYFSEIIDKISLNPYNLMQTIKYLEDLEIINISSEKKGYIISNTKKYKALSDISNGIMNVLEKKFEFVYKNIPFERFMCILSIIYIFECLDYNLQNIFRIKSEELNFLCKKSILSVNDTGIYIFHHDIIRKFFLERFSSYLLDSLKFVREKGIENTIVKYRTPYLLYKIAIKKDKNTIVEIGAKVASSIFPERLASIFYNTLLDAFVELLENNNYEGIYIKYIHNICSFIRQYDGSNKAWLRSKEIFDIIQTYYPDAISTDILFYRPFIHFCCDIAVQTHLNESARIFIKDVLEICKNTYTDIIENRDELYVLQAIMYNRWYISYNAESYKNEIALKRNLLMEKSRQYGNQIINVEKHNLIEYLNDSDEGYNYYGYYKDKEKLFLIWNKCMKDMPHRVPEKTLNFYRKSVQYGLIEQNYTFVTQNISNAFKYLEEGEYSHEPIIFKTFFMMAEVMANIQHTPEKSYYYNTKIIGDVLKMQQLLNNHILGDILVLKGVNAYYGKNLDDVYFSFKEAYKNFSEGKTTRYWIKKNLLEENIQYTFTVLGIYKTGYDLSFLPVECRQPLALFENEQFKASGIQRTSDLHLNLPLI